MLRLGAVVLTVDDVGLAREFWTRALGHAPRAQNPAFLLPPPGGAPRLQDLWVDSAAEQQAEVERLVALGARRVEWDYPDDADFVVLADPVGTVFCVVDASR